MFDIKKDFKKIIRRHEAFISLEEVDRPLLCVNVTGKNYAKSYSNVFEKIPQNREISPDDISIEEYIKDVNNFINWNETLDSDFIYPVVPYLYIPWTEAIIGCPIFLGKDSFYAEPFIKSWKDFRSELDLSENNKWFKKLIEMTFFLVEYLGDKYPVGSSTHLRGPVDMMAASLGQKEFPLELYDNPNKIQEMNKIYTEAFIYIAKKINNIAKKSRFNGYIVNIFGIWTEKICQFFQDDALVLTSPRFYKDLILKSHLHIDYSFPSTLYHIHPTSLFILDELVKFPNLKIIEINREPEAIGPPIEELIKPLKKIQDCRKAAILCFTDPDFTPDFIEKEIKIVCQELSYRGFCINIIAADVEDGKRKIQSISKIFNL